MAEPRKGSGQGGAMRIDTELVHELAKLLDENNLTEIEVEDGDRKIKVKREAPAMIAAAPAGPASGASTLSAPPSSPAAPPSQAEEVDLSGSTVKAPMVGTAFLSPEPGAKPFVSVGDAVKAGDTLLIVEAMKVMNPITAPTGGTIAKILVSDGQPIEFDQPLVVLA